MNGIKIMANNNQAKKRIRQNIKRAERNRSRISRIRGFVRVFDEAIAAGNKNDAQTAFNAAMPEMHRGVTKGVLNKKNVSRKLSRMCARVKLL